MDNFEKIKSENRLLYLAIRGSKAYGLDLPTSDTDMFGVYICPNEQIYGLSRTYQDEVCDAKHDTTWYEIGKFMEMLLKSNPTVLEMLFVDKEFVLYEHPLITEIKKHRQEFVTRKCFGAFIGYAYDQIKKARGLNKKIVEEPIKEHLKPLDFCYTFHKQGSTRIENWLNHRHLKQKYCGLVNIPSMHDTYGVYYDFGNHMLHEDWMFDKKFLDFLCEYYNIPKCFRLIKYWFVKYLMHKIKPIGYRGIVGETDDIHIENFEGKPKIFDLRLSSIDDKNTKPICHISYNSSGYTDHCKKYKEYKEWEENRNPVRFKENQNKEFDRKNIAHCVRLLHMGLEIAKTGEVHVNRRGIDRDFILNIRLGNTQYDEIMKYIEDKKDEMMKAMDESTLKKDIDVDFVNNLLIQIRKEFAKAN